MPHPPIYDLIDKIKKGGSGLYCGLEGPDGIGKSTVAFRVREIIGIKGFHRRSLAFGNPDGYNPNASLGMEWAALKFCGDHKLAVLEERTFLGFAIYANHQEFTEEIAKELIGLVPENHVYIFLQATPQNIHRRLSQRGEYVQNIDKDIQRYNEFVVNTPEVYKHLDIRTVNANQSVEDAAWEIVAILKEKMNA